MSHTKDIIIIFFFFSTDDGLKKNILKYVRKSLFKRSVNGIIFLITQIPLTDYNEAVIIIIPISKN